MKDAIIFLILFIVTWSNSFSQQNVGIGTNTPGSTLQVNGSFAAKYNSYSASTALAATDYFASYTGAAASVFTLPASTAVMSGREYIIKNAGTGAAYSTGTIYQSNGTSGTAGTTVTGTGTTFTSSMAGGVLTLAGGITETITAFNSTTSLTVSVSQAVGTSGARVTYSISPSPLTISANQTSFAEKIDGATSIAVVPGNTVTLVNTGLGAAGTTWNVVNIAGTAGSTEGTTNQIDVSATSGAENTSAIGIDPTYTSNLKANINLTGGGTVSYTNASALSWTARFIVMNDGRNSSFATAGYFDITMPSNGTVIPGYAGASNIMVASGTIILPGWQALYYILPLGNSNTIQNGNFAVVGYTSGAFTLPENWVLIAIRNGDDNTVRLGTGKILAPGQSWSAKATPAHYQIINENYGAGTYSEGPTNLGVDDGFTMFGSITNTVCGSPNATTVTVNYNNGLLFASTTSGSVTISGNGSGAVTLAHCDGGCGYCNTLTISSSSGGIVMSTTTNNGYFRYRFAWTY